jgi:hypothetical protein
MNIRLVHNRQETANETQKANMIRTLRGLLQDTFRLKNEGSGYARLSHAQGYADGYMRVLLDSQMVSQSELLTIVAEARRGVNGPATRVLSSEDSSTVGDVRAIPA